METMTSMCNWVHFDHYGVHKQRIVILCNLLLMT